MIIQAFLHLQVSLVQDSRHRPMDLRAQQPQHAHHGQQHLAQQAQHPQDLPEQGAAAAGLPHAGASDGANSSTRGAWELLLMVGSQVAAEVRRAVKVSHWLVTGQAGASA